MQGNRDLGFEELFLLVWSHGVSFVSKLNKEVKI
jgi:hypothetical protein